MSGFAQRGDVKNVLGAIVEDGKVVFFGKYHQDKKIDKIISISPYGLGDTMNLCGFKDALEKNIMLHFTL